MLSSQLFIICAALFARGFAVLDSDDDTMFIQQRPKAGIETDEHATWEALSNLATEAPLPDLVHGCRTMANMLKLPKDQAMVPFRGIDDEICWVQRGNNVADRQQLNADSQFDAKHRRSENAGTDVEMRASAKYASFVFNTTSLEQALVEYCDGDDSGSTIEKYGELPDWNVSQVTEIRFGYLGPRRLSCTSTFNGDVTFWNTAKVTKMESMFEYSPVFNKDISQWNTVMTQSLFKAFRYASAFNQNIGEWTTSSVTDMASVFQYAPEFNGNVGQWDTSKSETLSSVVHGAEKFNQPIGQWETSRVTNMFGVIRSTNFNQDIARWDTGRVVSFQFAFSRTSFNRNLQQWNVSIANLVGMFKVSTFNNDISGWSLGETDLTEMFERSLFNQNLQQWDTSRVKSLRETFDSAAVFNGNIQQWDTSRVSDLNSVFRNTAAFDQDLSQWNVSSVVRWSNTFLNSGLSNCSKYQIWSAWSSNTGFQYGDWSMYNECEAPAPVLADPRPLTLETNSLGGDGGQLRFSNMFLDGTELLVENTTEYLPFNANVTGLAAPSSSLAQISLGCGDTVEMKFEFMRDSLLVTPSAFNFTVADLDKGAHDRCSESIEMSEWNDYFLYPDPASSSINMTETAGRLRFTGLTVGSVEDNPEDIFNMTTEQKMKAVTFLVEGKNGFTMKFATTEPDQFSTDPEVVGYNGRRILFGFGNP